MIAALLALILAAVAVPVSAQEAAPAAPTAQELLASTLVKDISTASYYELVAWCEQLGLDDSGSRSDLQARLAKHFSVTLPAQPAAGKRSITIKQARYSEYYTDAEIGEKYVLLRGDVVVEVRDVSDGTLQVIKAASLIFNQSRRTISAEGGVTYTLTRGGQTDTFTGKSLAFNLDSSEAVFYDGSTSRVVKKTGTELTNTFSGETMTRISNDTVILQNGSFTSSDTPADPLFQVRAATVWLLAPGEWAVQNAVLLIGRVPILYLPGFFWPGDDFFFNPNVGYRSREGSFLQTTTYLIGHRKKEENPISFLQLGESGDAGYALEQRGLFLHKMPGTTAPKDSGHTLKLMLDAYSRLGFLAGLAGDFSPVGTFRTSIGLSRSIFWDSTSQLYTPYLPVGRDSYDTGEEFWNSTSFFGLPVPIRYGLEGSVKTSGTFYSMDAAFQYFSDPYFTSDFYTRSESSMLSALFTQQNTTTTTTAAQTNLSWDLSGKLDFTKMVNSPYVQNLSVSNLNLKMTWQSNTPSGLSDPEASDPGRAYYYPSSITAPNVSVTMSGDLLNVGGASPPAAAPAKEEKAPAAPRGEGGAKTSEKPADKTSEKPADKTSEQTAQPSAAPIAPTAVEKEPGKGLRSPWAAEAAPQPRKQEPVRIPFRMPTPQSDVTIAQAGSESTFKLSYQIQPRATLEHTFDTADWTTQKDVDYGFLYRTFETGGSSSLTAAATLWDRLADLSLSLSADGLWRSRFDPSPAEKASADWTSLLLLDQQQDRLAFRTSLQTTVYPFPAIQELSSSNLQYRMTMRMYQLSLAGTDPYNPTTITDGPAWTPEAVSEHSVASTLALVTPATSDSLAVTWQLPPLVPTMTARLDASGGPVKARAQGGFAAPESGIQYQPLIIYGSLELGTGIGLSEEMQFDLATSILSRSTSQVTLGPVSGSFVAENTGNPNKLEASTTKVGYESNGDPLWLWKDRIKIVAGLKTHWYLNYQTYTDNLFDFNPSLTLTIFKTLDLTFSSLSNNTRTYMYIPGWSAIQVNPLTDLLRSFNFFNEDDRTRSGFKIQTISLKAVQHFPDWDLSVTYSGSPQLITHTKTDGTQFQQNEWAPTFAIQVQWKGVTEIKSNIHQEYTGTETVPSLR